MKNWQFYFLLSFITINIVITLAAYSDINSKLPAFKQEVQQYQASSLPSFIQERYESLIQQCNGKANEEAKEMQEESQEVNEDITEQTVTQ